jgi:energy-coupling factor transport system substrate-specific component
MNSLLKPDTKDKIKSSGKASLHIRDIAIIGMMSAVLVAVQLALSFLPNIELVSLLIILFALIFGWKTLYIIYIFITVEGLLFGFGIWWFSWLYIWPVLFIITKIFHRVHSFYYWAVISGIFGLSFGALYAITIVVLDGPSAGFGAWVQGIIFDLVHGIGNFGVALVLFKPLYFVLEKINRQFVHRER